MTCGHRYELVWYSRSVVFSIIHSRSDDFDLADGHESVGVEGLIEACRHALPRMKYILE